MARLTVGQKTHRLLAFLTGLGNPDIVRALQRHGFDQPALEEGWTLLRRAASSHLDTRAPVRPSRDELERLDAWENRWFPIASAVLLRQHPAIHAEVFRNLTQTEGIEVVLSVGTFVERLDALNGEGGLAALVTLARHGLTGTVIDEARGLLASLTQPSIEPPDDAPGDDEPVVDPAAEDAMWSYYLQWSAIARSAISDRRLLRQLGFLRPQRSSGADDGQEGEPPADGPGQAPGGSAAAG